MSENNVVNEEPKVKVTKTPKEYYDRKDEIISKLKEDTDLHKMVVARSLPNNKMIEDIIENDIEAIDRYIERNDAVKTTIVRGMFTHTPKVLEDIFNELPRIPAKCKMCGEVGSVAIDGSGNIYCNTDGCVINTLSFVATLEEWDSKMNS